MDEKMLSVEQIATRLNVSVDAVRKYITVGVKGLKLKAIKLGKEYRVRPGDLEEFLEKLSRAA
jgi:excisionase family DNA binding protein